MYVMIVVVFFAIAAGLLLNRYQSTLSLAHDRLGYLASLHDENLLLQMRNIEGLARATVAEVRTHPDDNAYLQSYVDSIAQEIPQLRTLLILSQSGVILADSRPDRPALGMNASDRDYFIFHEDGQDNIFFVDDPVQSRIDGLWSLPMTLGIWSDDDEFIGIVIASLDPIHLSSTIGNFTEQNIEGFIVKDNDLILTSLPYDPAQIGMALPYPHADTSSAIFATDSELIAHQDVNQYNLSVVFVQTRADILQPFLVEVLVTSGVILLLSAFTFVDVRNHMIQTGRIQQSERELRTLTDNISDLVVRFDRNLRHLYVNPAVVESTGLTLAQYIGRTNRELGLPEEQVNFWEREISQVFETKVEKTIEFRFDDDHGERWYQAKLTPELDQTGHIHAVVSVVRDISDLKQVQQALVERTQTLTLSLQAAGAGVWVWNLATNEVCWDETIERIHGLPSGAFVGNYKTWRERVHPDDLERTEATLNISVETQSPWQEQFRIIQPDGAIRHVLAQAIVVTDSESDQPLRVIGVNIDITNRVDAEARRIDAERTRIEIEEQRKVIDLKERFIATASHDFRTPLTVIQSSVNMLQQYADHYTPEKRLEKLNTVQQQVTHMTRLMDDVLTISKSHANKMTMTPVTIDLRTFCDDIWNDIVTIDDGAHLKEFSYDATVEQIDGDLNLLRQVFENLLSNALKYTPPGKLVKFAVMDGDNALVFKVIDEGYGIPKSDQAHLFEPFFRARNVSSIKGTGLGLAIAWEFIALHNGTITVESSEGNGTTFTVKLPLAGN